MKRTPVILGLALAAGVGLSLAMAGRLKSPSAGEEPARRQELIAEATRALERDAGTLAAVAASLQRSPEFATIVAGGTEIRPARLFALLSETLPPGAGWGAVFFDPAGRAVAWGGEAEGLVSESSAEVAGLSVSFHVTRFTLAYRSPRMSAFERRGVLVISRRYPTGILRPDLAEFLALRGAPGRLRLRVRAASGKDALVALFVEPPDPELARDDLGRLRAAPGGLLAATSLLILSVLSGAPLLGLAAARLALLLASPRASWGLWEVVFPRTGLDLGLLATPADLVLTGLCTLFAVRLAWRRAAAAPRRGWAVRVSFTALGLALSLLPFHLARQAGLLRPDLFDSIALVPESAAAYAAELGAVALGVAAVGLAAWLFAAALAARSPAPATTRLLAVAGVVLLIASLFAAGGRAAAPLGILGSALLAVALASRAGQREADLLSRLASAVFLVAIASLAMSAGLADGKLRRLDSALLSARRSASALIAEARLSLWESRVMDPGIAPWLPAGERTTLSDLARALWVRGGSAEFPGEGDVLTVRAREGDVLSSFGIPRPGRERGARLAAEVPVRGVTASFTRIPDPRESDRDPLLSAAATRYLPERVNVERVEYDAAGRPAPARGTDRLELPPRLLAAAQRKGIAFGSVTGTESVRRFLVIALSPGYVTFSANSDTPLIALGTVVAAGEASLPVVVPLLVLAAGAVSRRRGSLRLTLATFRGRLVLLVFLFGALPVAGSVAAVRFALDRHALEETRRRARALLAEARRALGEPLLLPEHAELNRAAAVVGSDVLLYRNGILAAASRALPVAAEIAHDRLSANVAQALVEGRAGADTTARRLYPGGPRLVEAAEPLAPDEALAVVIAEDEAGRLAVDSLVLFTVAVALVAFGLGWRAALSLSRPLEELVDAAERLGTGGQPAIVARPRAVDLARLVDAFQEMAERVRERTESLARERAAAVGLVTNLTAAVILFRDKDGGVLLSNHTADRLLPGSSLPERLESPIWAPLKALLSQPRRAEPLETRVSVGEEGSARVFRVVVASLPPDGSEARSFLLLEDLTDFMRADRLTAWVEAARSIAHDIKNPLTPIRLAGERVLRLVGRGETPAPPTLSMLAGTILRQVEVLTERIGRLMRFSDPSALELRRFDAEGLRALMEEVASDYAGSERVRVGVSVTPGLPPVAADRALLRDALSNFVVNAVEALGEGGGTVVLSAEPAELPDATPGVRITCEDDGPGVPEEQLERLFDPSFSTKSRGSGMGLAATRRAVERQGGTVLARRGPAGGLLIGFTLPVEAAS